MQRLISGKEEICYLLTKVIERFKLETGQEIIQNTNRKNYEVIAIALSEISNQLPFKWELYGTEVYAPERNLKNQEYPYRKYDITGGQIKDALNGIVSNPRSFLVDACYIYLFGIGRKRFEQNPMDVNLLEKLGNKNDPDPGMDKENPTLKQQFVQLQKENRRVKKRSHIVIAIAAILLMGIIGLFLYYSKAKNAWAAIKKDLNILPYQPTDAEIDSLEGIWLCYTGSPQARISDPDRYHKVVPNIIDIKYKNGYFTFKRYGASFDHIGYMQFQSPGIVSVYSRIQTNSAKTESPRHSLLNLNSNRQYLSAISASWSFDIGERNKIIGIREIYIKQGRGGTIEEVMNEVENASCKCKIIQWHQSNREIKSYFLKNELLDSLTMKEIQPLINENSILIGTPQPGLVIGKDSMLQ
jgi:hypothetical protein